MEYRKKLCTDKDSIGIWEPKNSEKHKHAKYKKDDSYNNCQRTAHQIQCDAAKFCRLLEVSILLVLLLLFELMLHHALLFF